MDTTTTQIQKFIIDIQKRNRLELITCIILLLIFGFYAVITPVGSLSFIGIILIILAILFIFGMLWFIASVRNGVKVHPVTDIDYWKSEILRHAKLLRLVPIWYLAPFVPGLILMFWPIEELSLAGFIISLVIIAAVFGFIARLNLKAAIELERLAESLVIDSDKK